MKYFIKEYILHNLDHHWNLRSESIIYCFVDLDNSSNAKRAFPRYDEVSLKIFANIQYFQLFLEVSSIGVVKRAGKVQIINQLVQLK